MQTAFAPTASSICQGVSRSRGQLVSLVKCGVLSEDFAPKRNRAPEGARSKPKTNDERPTTSWLSLSAPEWPCAAVRPAVEVPSYPRRPERGCRHRRGVPRHRRCRQPRYSELPQHPESPCRWASNTWQLTELAPTRRAARWFSEPSRRRKSCR